MKPIFGLPLLWAIFTGGIHAADPSNWRVEAKLEIGFDSLNEVSGISRSPRFANQFWLHNDSGDCARLSDSGNLGGACGEDDPWTGEVEDMSCQREILCMFTCKHIC